MTTTLHATPTRLDGPLSAVDRWLIGLELFLAIGAYAGAWGLISGTVDASSYIDDLPGQSAVFAGFALGLVNGVVPTIAIVGALTRRSWARLAHLVVGIALMGWIGVQVAIIGPLSWLQPAMFALGAAIFVLAFIEWRRTPRSSE